MTHIAHVIDLLQVGGAQNLIKTFAIEALQHGIEVSVVSLDDISGKIPAQELASLGIQVKAFPAHHLADITRFNKLLHYFRSQKFDIIQTHLSYANILGGFAGRISGIPVVSTLHTSGNDQQKSKVNPFSSPRSRAETLALRLFPSRIIAVGECVAQAHSSRIPGEKIDVIMNAVEHVKPINTSERQNRRQQVLGDEGKTILVSVGRFAVVKEFPSLITSFSLVNKHHPETRLLLIGDGSERSRIEKQISDLGLEQDVILLGRRNDVSEWLQSSDIYVSSSSMEGLPMSILEAMSVGLPIVATSVGDIPSIVKPETGYLVPPNHPDQLANCICELLDDPRRCEKMGKAASQFIDKNFNVAAWFEQVLNLYGQVLGKSSVELYSEQGLS